MLASRGLRNVEILARVASRSHSSSYRPSSRLLEAKSTNSSKTRALTKLNSYHHNNNNSSHSYSSLSSSSSSSVGTLLSNSLSDQKDKDETLKISHLSHSQFLFPHHHNHTHIQRRYKSTFVSKHNDIPQTDITSFLTRFDLKHKLQSGQIIVESCPFCHDIKGREDNMYKLNIKGRDGAYFCHRCGAKGSWYDFKSKLAGFEITDANGNSPSSVPQSRKASTFSNSNSSQSSSSRANNSAFTSANKYAREKAPKTGPPSTSENVEHSSPMPSQSLTATYSTSLLDLPRNAHIREYLINVRGLNAQVLRKYGVGCAVYNFPDKDRQGYVKEDCITFPWIMRASEVEEQETLRGGVYKWKKKGKAKDDEKAAGWKKKEEESVTPEAVIVDSITADDGADTDSDADADADITLSLAPSTDSQTEPITSEVLSADAAEALAEAAAEALANEIEKEYGPWVTRRIKARALNMKSRQRLDPPGGGWGLFGWHTVPLSATSIVITEGEYDAMAVYQATGIPAVSLPNGCRSLPVEVLPLLERFNKIYLWMDNDGPGQEGVQVFAKKLGLGRCMIVRPLRKGRDENNNTIQDDVPLPKDANDALLQGFDMQAMIDMAMPLPHQNILTFAELRDQVLHEVSNPLEYSGYPVPSLPEFTKIVKGFRRGEMTVVTGATGAGKTTFLSQLSLDFAEQGINALWGSFEVKNTRLLKKLLHQFSRGPLPLPPKGAEALEALADRFEELPLYFMRFHGGSAVEDIIDAMDYAVYVNDVEHIILDNLQFMLSRGSGGRGGKNYDKYESQDSAIEIFRRFASERNVHVTLVVHPRKEDENSKLGIASIFGSAKATQEADTVLILQTDGTRKFIDVKKNRYDGSLGMVPLFFQHHSSRYAETEGGETDESLKSSMMKSGKDAYATPSPHSSVHENAALKVAGVGAGPGPAVGKAFGDPTAPVQFTLQSIATNGNFAPKFEANLARTTEAPKLFSSPKADAPPKAKTKAKAKAKVKETKDKDKDDVGGKKQKISPNAAFGKPVVEGDTDEEEDGKASTKLSPFLQRKADAAKRGV